MEYLIHLSIIGCIFSVFAQSFNFAFGLGRLFNLAHVSTYAVGAYTAALLPTFLESNFSITLGFTSTLLCAAVFATVTSIPLAAIAARLSGDYFAIGTLALAYLVSNTLTNWRSLTNGVLGIAGIQRPIFLGGLDTNDNLNFLFVLLIISCLVHMLFFSLSRGALGRRLRASAEFPQAASACGISPVNTQGLTFVISAFACGMAGACYALYISFIDPSSFGLEEMIAILTVVVLGGPGSVIGCIFASFGILALGEAMRFIPFAPSVLGPARQIVYALILFTVLWVKKDTLFKTQRVI